jgi:hypothetical protein
VLYLQLIIFSVRGDHISVNSEAFLVTDFINLKIKPVQSFKDAYKGRMCVCVHRGECSYVYKYLHLYCVSKKNHSIRQSNKL